MRQDLCSFYLTIASALGVDASLADVTSSRIASNSRWVSTFDRFVLLGGDFGVGTSTPPQIGA
jgi:hypothetical protein